MRHRWGVTVAVAVLLTDAVPSVPEAVAVLVSAPAMLMVRLALSDWLWPGASGPQLPTLKSSPGLPGVPASSTNVPGAAKKSPVLRKMGRAASGEWVPVHTSVGLAGLARAMVQMCGVTVAVAVLRTEPVPLVPAAVAVFVNGAAMLIVRVAVRVWL